MKRKIPLKNYQCIKKIVHRNNFEESLNITRFCIQGVSRDQFQPCVLKINQLKVTEMKGTEAVPQNHSLHRAKLPPTLVLSF